MTEIRRLTDNFSVAPMVAPAEVGALADRFGLLINNRADGEEPGQASSAQIEAAARASGMDYAHIPIAGGRLSDDDIASFDRVVGSQTRPVLAFCRSGTRSTLLWALSQAGRRDLDDILATARGAGYDLTPLIPMLRQRVQKMVPRGGIEPPTP